MSSPSKHAGSQYETAAGFAQRIEEELKSMGVWQTSPPPPKAFESTAAFYADTMSYYQWLQFVLLKRIRKIVEERGTFPQRSQTGAYAVRELHGHPEASELINALSEFDDFIESTGKPPAPPKKAAPRKRAATKKPEKAASPAKAVNPFAAAEDALPALAEQFCESLAGRGEPVPEVDRSAIGNPNSTHGRDVGLAERVFKSVKRFREALPGVGEYSDARTIDLIVEANRGLWVIRLAARQNRSWTISHGTSLVATTDFYLRQHHIHAPFAGEGSARAAAMEFWTYLMRNDTRRASTVLLPDQQSADLPTFGQGWVDEFCWYAGVTEPSETEAEVRLLMNTQEEHCFWFTPMVKRGKEWLVNWAQTRREEIPQSTS
ncbi:MAG: YqcC family protein [Bdellovibrionales bacterium]|nr:YqcC family protein [Bdellovibrionales bacterium]